MKYLIKPHICLSVTDNVPSIGEGADFRAENLIQAVQPLFCLYCVMRSGLLINKS